MIFIDQLNEASDPYNLQTIGDLLSALAGAINPDSSQLGGNRDVGVQIKPRDGFEQDQPSDAETSGNPSVDVIDKELRYYRNKYNILPSLSPDTSYRQTVIRPAPQESGQLTPAEVNKLLAPAAKKAAKPPEPSKTAVQNSAKLLNECRGKWLERPHSAIPLSRHQRSCFQQKDELHRLFWRAVTLYRIFFQSALENRSDPD
jgi:hypothetical protein